MHGHVKCATCGSGFCPCIDAGRLLSVHCVGVARFSARLRVLSLAFLIEPYLIRYLKQNSTCTALGNRPLSGGNQPLFLSPRLGAWLNADIVSWPATPVAIWFRALAVFWLAPSLRKAIPSPGGIARGSLLAALLCTQRPASPHAHAFDGLVRQRAVAWLVAAFSGKLS